MRNKKSVLMTLNHNFGYFSGVGFGIAGNVLRLCDGGASEYKCSINHYRHTIAKPMLAVVLGVFRKMFKIFTKISYLKIN
jgi:hypothetical protein